MQYPGFVESENLLGEKDSSVIVTISAWERSEDWREWEKSVIRQQLYDKVKELLEDEPQAQMYRIVATNRWG